MNLKETHSSYLSLNIHLKLKSIYYSRAAWYNLQCSSLMSLLSTSWLFPSFYGSFYVHVMLFLIVMRYLIPILWLFSDMSICRVNDTHSNSILIQFPKITFWCEMIKLRLFVCYLWHNHVFCTWYSLQIRFNLRSFYAQVLQCT